MSNSLSKNNLSNTINKSSKQFMEDQELINDLKVILTDLTSSINSALSSSAQGKPTRI